MILDRNDMVIAHDILEKTVYIDKYHFLNVEVAAGSLASIQLRNLVENTGEVGLEKEIAPLLDKKSYSNYQKWSDFSRRERIRLRSSGAKILMESMHADEIVKLNAELVIDEYYRPLGLTKEELTSYINLKKKGMHVIAKKGLNYSAARKLEELLDLHGVKGFDFHDYVRREYPEPLMATHIVGVVDHKRKGVSGIEGKMNDYLKGRDGKETKFLDARGYSIAGDQETLPPQHGRDIRLTLDMKVQAIVEEELDRGMEYYDCERGSVIIMEPNTGEILAMASRPHYNLNTKEGMKTGEFHFAIQAQNETGSTIKIVALSGALNEKSYTYNSKVDCGYGIIKGPGLTPPVKDHFPYGILPFWKVMQKSSNTGTYRIAEKLGKKNFYQYLSKFGYGKRTGIQLVGEAKGKADHREKQREFASSTYGYMVSASPIQVATAYSVVANGGTYIPPRVIKDIHTKEGYIVSGKDIERKSPAELQVLRPEVAAQIRSALKTVIEKEGTATRAYVEGYSVGGKTGTNHRYGKTGYMNKKGEEEYLTSFAGMCPIEKPNFVCVIVMDHPKRRSQLDEKGTGQEIFKPSGGTVAAPMFAKICKRIAPVLGVVPQYKSQASR